MAMSREFAEELTCPIHLEFYDEPMLLKCLHILCQKDVEQMSALTSKVRCPVCSEISHLDDIKKDFRTQKLIEIHKTHTDIPIIKDVETHAGEQLCEFCEEEHVTCKCQDCNSWIGEKCKKVHQKMKVTKDHKIVTLATVISETKEKLSTMKQTINDTLPNCHTLHQEWQSARNDLNACITNANESVQKSKHEILAKVEEIHETLSQNIRNETEPDCHHAEEIVQKLEDLSKQLKENRDLLQIIMDDDKNILKNYDQVEEILKASDMACQDMTTICSPPDAGCQVTVTPYDNVIKALDDLKVLVESHKMAEPRGPQDQMALINKPTQVENEAVIGKPKTWLDFKFGKKVNLTSTVCHDFRSHGDKRRPRSLATVGEEIWVVQDNGSIDVFDYYPNCDSSWEIKRTIHAYAVDSTSWGAELVTKYKTQQVCFMKTGSIIAGLKGVKETQLQKYKHLGIVEIDQQGRIQTIISSEQQDSISHDGSYLFSTKNSYEMYSNVVLINEYKHGQSGWACSESLQLYKSDYYDISANSCLVFQPMIAYTGKDPSKIYFNDKQKERTHGVEMTPYLTSTEDGEKKIQICGADTEGNLICREQNDPTNFMIFFKDNTVLQLKLDLSNLSPDVSKAMGDRWTGDINQAIFYKDTQLLMICGNFLLKTIILV